MCSSKAWEDFIPSQKKHVTFTWQWKENTTFSLLDCILPIYVHMKTFGWTCTITPFTSPATSEQTYNSCCLDKWQNYVISASSKLTSSCPKTPALLLNSTCMKTWVWTSRLPSLTGRKTRREGQDVRFWRWLSIKRSKHWFSFTSRKSGTIRIHFTRQSSQPGTSTLQFRQGETRGKRCYQKVVEQQQFPPNEIHNLQTTNPFLT